MRMRVSVEYLLSKPEDFKVCKNCGCFNWYERISCHNCGSGTFRRATEDDVESYVETREKEDEHFCLECEIDV